MALVDFRSWNRGEIDVSVLGKCALQVPDASSNLADVEDVAISNVEAVP